ncbi:hypothetical protein CVT25_002496, partial [Psilocybe cyanescens]
QEINYLWKGPKNRSSYWFFINRYTAFFGNIAVTILGFMDLSSRILLIVNQVLVCILLTLRVFALYDRSLRVLAYLITSGVILMAVTSWVMFGQKSAPSETASGCHVGFSRMTFVDSSVDLDIFVQSHPYVAYLYTLRILNDIPFPFKGLAGAWEALFVYDSIIFALTIVKTWKARQDHAITGISIPLISLMLRDGAIYFAVMALCNFANILTYYPFLRGGLSTFASSISVTMMSRLMLNLHETADAGIFSIEATTTRRNHMEQYTDDTLDIVHPSTVSDAETIRSQRRKSR